MGFGDWITKQPGFDIVGDFLGIGESSARKQNEINRNWQENLSNTAIQRRVKDLKEAGINPILATQGEGATTPGGSSGAGGQGGGAISNIANSAMKQASKNQKLQNENLKLQNQKLSILNSALKTKILKKGR